MKTRVPDERSSVAARWEFLEAYFEELGGAPLCHGQWEEKLAQAAQRYGGALPEALRRWACFAYDSYQAEVLGMRDRVELEWVTLEHEEDEEQAAQQIEDAFWEAFEAAHGALDPEAYEAARAEAEEEVLDVVVDALYARDRAAPRYFSLMIQGEEDMRWAVRAEDLMLEDPPVHVLHYAYFEGGRWAYSHQASTRLSAFVLGFFFHYLNVKSYGEYGEMSEAQEQELRERDASQVHQFGDVAWMQSDARLMMFPNGAYWPVQARKSVSYWLA